MCRIQLTQFEFDIEKMFNKQLETKKGLRKGLHSDVEPAAIACTPQCLLEGRICYSVDILGGKKSANIVYFNQKQAFILMSIPRFAHVYRRK